MFFIVTKTTLRMLVVLILFAICCVSVKVGDEDVHAEATDFGKIKPVNIQTDSTVDKSETFGMDSGTAQLLKDKLKIVTEISSDAEAKRLLSDTESSILVVYFGNFQKEDASHFQSSIDLLALVAKLYSYRHITARYAQLNNPAITASLRAQAVSEHSIVICHGLSNYPFYGIRNAAVLGNFVDSVLNSQVALIKKLSDKKNMIDKLVEYERIVLFLEDNAQNTKKIKEILPYVKVFRIVDQQLAKRFQLTSFGSVLYYAANSYKGLIHTLENNEESLQTVLQQFRERSTFYLTVHNLYAPSSIFSPKPVFLMLADPTISGHYHMLQFLQEFFRSQRSKIYFFVLNPLSKEAKVVNWKGVLRADLSRLPAITYIPTPGDMFKTLYTQWLYLHHFSSLKELPVMHSQLMTEFNNWMQDLISMSGADSVDDDL